MLKLGDGRFEEYSIGEACIGVEGLV